MKLLYNSLSLSTGIESETPSIFTFLYLLFPIFWVIEMRAPMQKLLDKGGMHRGLFTCPSEGHTGTTTHTHIHTPGTTYCHQLTYKEGLWGIMDWEELQFSWILFKLCSQVNMPTQCFTVHPVSETLLCGIIALTQGANTSFILQQQRRVTLHFKRNQMAPLRC